MTTNDGWMDGWMELKTNVLTTRAKYLSDFYWSFWKHFSRNQKLTQPNVIRVSERLPGYLMLMLITYWEMEIFYDPVWMFVICLQPHFMLENFFFIAEWPYLYLKTYMLYVTVRTAI